MSPEQALGDRLDRRSDLFSVGAVLFECITGRPMWGTGTDVELMRKLALQQPPALDPRTYNVPPRLASLHARLVARDPATRPGSANEVARELRELAGATDVTESSAELRSLMTDLFADAAADRRVTLARSLDREAPSRAEDLRRNLAPGTEVGGAVAGDRPGLNAPRRHLRRTAVAAAAIAAIVATAVVEAGAMRAPSRIKPTPAPNVEVDVAVPATAVRDPAPIVVQGPTTGNVTTDPSPPVPRVARSTASAPIPAPARHVAGKPAPTHASDVDPTPF
jgi:serine/threonine-protein kinase